MYTFKEIYIHTGDQKWKMIQNVDSSRWKRSKCKHKCFDEKHITSSNKWKQCLGNMLGGIVCV